VVQHHHVFLGPCVEVTPPGKRQSGGEDDCVYTLLFRYFSSPSEQSILPGCSARQSFFLSLCMITRLRHYLIRYARQQAGTVSYLTLLQETELGLNLDISHEKSRLNEMLAEISTEEHAAGRPLLSSLVRVQGSKGQGDNFYKLCERLGYGEWRTLKQDENFLKGLIKECHEFWQQEANYAQYALNEA
jgi:hypothetical protein